MSELEFEPRPPSASTAFTADTHQEGDRGGDIPMEGPQAPATGSGQKGEPAAVVGRLDAEGLDAMTLHTLDAWRMFTGRAGDASARVPAISGGRRFAAVMRSVWTLSANDNPYADWILIRCYQQLAALRKQMDQAITAREAEFERLRQRGLNLSVLASRSPVTVSLGFRSPYGYAVAEAMVAFDYHVRMVRTLVLKDRMSDEEGRSAIRAIGRGLRALFLEPIRWERILMGEAMLPLSRQDFLGGTDADARLRVQMAVKHFGELPREVYTGEIVPRHSQRRARPTAVELRLLREASLTAELADAMAHAAPGAVMQVIPKGGQAPVEERLL
jgi:integrating conjugative element protein (TIGR03761 family)